MIISTPIQARYNETDQMGIIHHSIYPIWFEIGRNTFIRALGMRYSQMEKNNILIPVTNLSVKYYRPAYFEDDLNISTGISLITPARIRFFYQIHKDTLLLTEGTTTHAFVKKSDFKVMNLKKQCPHVYVLLKESCASK